MALDDGMNPFDLTGTMPAIPPPLAASVPILMPPPVAPPVEVADLAGSVPADALIPMIKQSGWGDPQAYALTGNMKQESELRPGIINPGEGAHGLIQWREGRWDNLQAYAKAIGASPTDPATQVKFIRQEMGLANTNPKEFGPNLPGWATEKSAGQAFANAKDIDSANRALKNYIRYGDDSEETRRQNAYNFAGTPMSPNKLASTRHIAPTPDEVAQTNASQGSAPSADAGVDPNAKASLMKMMLAASLANVRLQPVDYDPYKVMPHISY